MGDESALRPTPPYVPDRTKTVLSFTNGEQHPTVRPFARDHSGLRNYGNVAEMLTGVSLISLGGDFAATISEAGR